MRVACTTCQPGRWDAWSVNACGPQDRLSLTSQIVMVHVLGLPRLFGIWCFNLHISFVSQAPEARGSTGSPVCFTLVLQESTHAVPTHAVPTHAILTHAILTHAIPTHAIPTHAISICRIQGLALWFCAQPHCVATDRCSLQTANACEDS